ncbi:MAG: GGDEF domain-containing protein [Porticoccaceae bacterium]|nr:GGDEF domain-containing protein [Porticoccaceae bacterium]
MSPIFVRLAIPAVCFAAALILRNWFISHGLNNPTEDLTFLLLNLPYILLALSALLALLSEHAVEAGISLCMLCAYWLVQTQLQVPLETQPAGQIYYLLNLLLPCLIFAYAFLPEQSYRQPLGLAAIALAPVIIILLARIMAFDSQLFFASAQQALGNPVFSHLSAASSALYLIVFGVCLGLCIYRQQTLESSLLGCTLITYSTFGWIHLSHISAFMFSAIGVLLSINLIISLLTIGYRDELTQIGNRRALKQSAKNLRGSYSVAMVDADYFKKINDQYGHDLGDQALRVIAGLLRKTADGAKPFRYGGEEFCLLFKGKSRQEVIDTLENIRQAIANYDMVIRDKKHRPRASKQGEKRRGASRRNGDLRLTVSIGVASSDNSGQFDQVLKKADKALYRAKARGRNRVQAA